MLNINELENRWRKYKIKSYLPYGIITLSIVIIFTIIFIFLPYNKVASQATLIKKTKNIHKKIEAEVKKERNVETIKTIKKGKIDINNHNKTTLSPSLNFMSKIKHDTFSNYENNKLTQLNKEKKVQKKKVTKVKAPKEYIEKLSTVLIDRKNAQEGIEHVIKRFKKSNNPALSLFIAKKYYELGVYSKSYNYALLTNQINDNIDASWIIFSKSLVKLNEKEEAIQILKKYIQHSHSLQAKILLEEIKSGKFR
ncbi:hypothetical protein [Sulfurimonas sp.]|uniref:hypothetical protein n=1 Tax=Sulfurimonas sp. TaxID=2022749 RepID=UPI002B49AC15|nr:hypothetical protein [Sulfurimonas sp.]